MPLRTEKVLDSVEHCGRLFYAAADRPTQLDVLENQSERLLTRCDGVVVAVVAGFA